MESNKEKPKILIVDDISINVELMQDIIESEGYEALCALSVQEALDIMNETMPQLILSDFSMPGMNGLEFCKLLKSNQRTRDIPFIFITVANSREEKEQAFYAGAVDFIPKPFEPVEVIMRVNNQLANYYAKLEMEDYNRMIYKMMTEQKKHIEKERENVLLALAKVLEKRDVHKTSYLERIGYNCSILAQSLQLIPQYETFVTDNFIETIGVASRLHDIGTILISDALLFNENLSQEEQLDMIKIHTEEGAKILEEIDRENNQSNLLDMAIHIARYHHANWDGTGYPKNLKGDAIPLEARITTIVNDFDLMLCKPCDDRKVLINESLKKINDRSGTVYDPHIVEVFNKVFKQLMTESKVD
ncbi:MAG: response regulator [Lachnospira sp.]|nr:response regulator [Lachnospira sp.]